jgi:hypothetical protein
MTHGTRSDALEKATEVEPHKDSASSSRFNDAFYSDCFARQVVGKPFDTALAAYLAMSAKAPRWVNRLLWLRDRIVAPFGMTPTHGFNAHQKQAPIFKLDDPLDFFNVATINPDELELQLRDRHFTVAISLYLYRKETAQILYVTSIVTTRTRVGKGYVSVIAPFHRVVVKSMLNRLS